MNGPRFTWPNDSTPPRANQGASDIPEALRQKIVAGIREWLAHDDLPDNVAEHFGRESQR